MINLDNGGYQDLDCTVRLVLKRKTFKNSPHNCELIKVVKLECDSVVGTRRRSCHASNLDHEFHDIPLSKPPDFFPSKKRFSTRHQNNISWTETQEVIH
jgi:hypothetical protein